VKYHLPFSGDPQVLGCAPNPRVPNSYPVTVEGAEVCFEIIDFSGNAESIKRNEEQVCSAAGREDSLGRSRHLAE